MWRIFWKSGNKVIHSHAFFRFTRALCCAYLLARLLAQPLLPRRVAVVFELCRFLAHSLIYMTKTIIEETTNSFVILLGYLEAKFSARRRNFPILGGSGPVEYRGNLCVPPSVPPSIRPSICPLGLRRRFISPPRWLRKGPLSDTERWRAFGEPQ